jgi:hypothetical protein
MTSPHPSPIVHSIIAQPAYTLLSSSHLISSRPPPILHTYTTLPRNSHHPRTLPSFANSPPAHWPKPNPPQEQQVTAPPRISVPFYRPTTRPHAAAPGLANVAKPGRIECVLRDQERGYSLVIWMSGAGLAHATARPLLSHAASPLCYVWVW